MRPDDDVEFVLGTGRELPGGAVFRAIPQDDQWQIANIVYDRGGPMVVSDYRGKGQYRTWRVTPVVAPERGVILEPLHDDGTFFRGGKAFSADPLVLATGARSVLDHIESQTSFNRVSVASATGKGWGDVSRWLALFHNYGFVRPTGAATWYGPESEAVLALKSEKDREHAPGNRMNYERTDSWPSLRAQFDDMVSMKLKNVEAQAVSALVAADEEPGPADGDLVAGDGQDELGPGPVDEGPVPAPEVPDEEALIEGLDAAVGAGDLHVEDLNLGLGGPADVARTVDVEAESAANLDEA